MYNKTKGLDDTIQIQRFINTFKKFIPCGIFFNMSSFNRRWPLITCYFRSNKVSTSNWV